MKRACIEWGSRGLIILGITTLLVFPSEELIADGAFLENGSMNLIANYSIGLAVGARDFLVENAKCIFYILEHPLISIQEMLRAVIHINDTYFAIKNYVLQTIALHDQLSMAEKGRLHLHLLGDIFYTVGWVTVPAISLGKVERLSRLLERSSSKVKALAQTLSERTNRALPKFDLQQSIGFVEWFAYDQ